MGACLHRVWRAKPLGRAKLSTTANIIISVLPYPVSQVLIVSYACLGSFKVLLLPAQNPSFLLCPSSMLGGFKGFALLLLNRILCYIDLSGLKKILV